MQDRELQREVPLHDEQVVHKLMNSSARRIFQPTIFQQKKGGDVYESLRTIRKKALPAESISAMICESL
jgi:hypothetical protein